MGAAANCMDVNQLGNALACGVGTECVRVPPAPAFRLLIRRSACSGSGCVISGSGIFLYIKDRILGTSPSHTRRKFDVLSRGVSSTAHCRILIWHPTKKEDPFDHKVLWKGITAKVTAVAFHPLHV